MAASTDANVKAGMIIERKPARCPPSGSRCHRRAKVCWRNKPITNVGKPMAIVVDSVTMTSQNE